jgi:hypothetical protein
MVCARTGKRQGKEESSALSRFALDPDPAAVYLDNSLHERQTYACAFALDIQFVE